MGYRYARFSPGYYSEELTFGILGARFDDASIHGAGWITTSVDRILDLKVCTKISQETLAEMIGTTRSRVSFFMNKFRELGFIDYNGSGVEIHSSLLNVVLHDQPQIKT